jgi:hypothetical protein
VRLLDPVFSKHTLTGGEHGLDALVRLLFAYGGQRDGLGRAACSGRSEADAFEYGGPRRTYV